MEKRIFGIILTLLGAIGLIMAGVSYMNGQGTRQTIIYGVLGIIFFFAGISLLKNTSSKPT